jgi:GNAT superfamily N-acetyltransferase
VSKESGQLLRVGSQIGQIHAMHLPTAPAGPRPPTTTIVGVPAAVVCGKHEPMTETLSAHRGVLGVTIRAYRPSDHNACRRLWGELTRHHAALFGEADEQLGDAEAADAGAGFEEYLTQLNLSGMWVADDAEIGVAGFVGLMLDGRSGEVDPVVVTAAKRGRGIGRALVIRVADEARRRGLHRLSISPPIRDLPALHSMYAAGFETLATVTLAYDLTGHGAGHAVRAPLNLYDLRFNV